MSSSISGSVGLYAGADSGNLYSGHHIEGQIGGVGVGKSENNAMGAGGISHGEDHVIDLGDQKIAYGSEESLNAEEGYSASWYCCGADGGCSTKWLFDKIRAAGTFCSGCCTCPSMPNVSSIQCIECNDDCMKATAKIAVAFLGAAGVAFGLGFGLG